MSPGTVERFPKIADLSSNSGHVHRSTDERAFNADHGNRFTDDVFTSTGQIHSKSAI